MGTYNKTSDESIMSNSLVNNTFYIDKTHETIKHTIENSFSYLKDLQKSLVTIGRFNLSNEDCTMTRNGTMSYIIQYNMVDVSKREAFRRSELYGKLLHTTDITNNSLFAVVPFMLVDNKFYDKFIIRCNLDNTIEFIMEDTNFHWLDYNHEVKIVFFRNTYYEKFTSNKYIFEKYDWVLPKTITKLNIPNDDTGEVFAFIKDTKNDYGTNLIHLESIDGELNMNAAPESIKAYIKESSTIEIHILYISDLYELEDLYESKDRSDSSDNSCTIVIQPEEFKTYNMPIPTNNLLIFSLNEETGDYELENNLDIELHYPNFYEIKNGGNKKYKVYYLYREYLEAIKYNNIFTYAYKYLSDKFGKIGLQETIDKFLYDKEFYENNTSLYEFILTYFNYEVKKFVYDMGDFTSSIFPYNFDYKINKLKDLIEYDDNVLIDYVKRSNRVGESYYLYTQTIDLPKRIRKDTSNEIYSNMKNYVFDEDMYLFLFRNDSNELLSLRFFIDGLYCYDTYSFHLDTSDYIYIPTRWITENSYIEIEKFTPYKKDVVLKYDVPRAYKYIELDDTEKAHPTLFDIYLSDDDGNIIDRRNFSIYAILEDGQFNLSTDEEESIKVDTLMLDNRIKYDNESEEYYIDVDELFESVPSIEDESVQDGYVVLDNTDMYVPNEIFSAKYLFLTKFKIASINDKYLNMNIHVNINKRSYVINKIAKETSIPKVDISYGSTYNFKPSTTYIRLFCDGKFLPITEDASINKIENISSLFCNYMIKKGEELTVDVTPYSYILKYFSSEIPDDFIIKFNTSLGKPFDLSYFDVYLNGRKLNETNIIQLSTTSIKLINVHSKNNFYIYEKDRDSEYYGYKTASPSITPQVIDELLNSDIITDQDKSDLLDMVVSSLKPELVEVGDNDNSEENINNGKVLTAIDKQINNFYVDRILPIPFLRTDINQFSSEDIESNYKYIYDNYVKNNILLLDPDKNAKASLVLLIAGEQD